MAFSPDGLHLAICTTSSSAHIYRRNNDVFSKVRDFSIANTYGIAFSPNGNYLAISRNDAVGVDIYRRVGEAYNKMPSLVNPLSNLSGVAFSSDSLNMVFSSLVTPYVTGYRISYDTNNLFKLPTQSVEGTGLVGWIKT